jgi:biofilm PGA synthesis N-glycosyltransferase PgaC
MTLLVTAGVIRHFVRERFATPANTLYRPRVSCIIPCYREGDLVSQTLRSLCEQTYAGEIELVPVIDGATINSETLQAVRDFRIDPAVYPRRVLRPIAKWQRGGRVSTLNAGLNMCTGDVVLALDGDTSFDVGMVGKIVRHFEDPAVPAVAGSLRVRNASHSLITRLQAFEYLLSIQFAKTGLSEWNLINNVSGAFGAFRRSFLQHIGGWDTHTAEDLDATLRIKSYFRRHRFRIPFEPQAVGHTDAPPTFRDFFSQRLRWDGDLFFMYVRKHRHSLSPRLLGWPNFISVMVNGLFFQLVTPFLIVIYTLFCLTTLPFRLFLLVTTLIYLLYFSITLTSYLFFLLMVSDRPKEDLKLAVVLPIFPFFTFAQRCWGVVCTLNEVLRRGHEESTMAPWWVLKRGRKF